MITSLWQWWWRVSNNSINSAYPKDDVERKESELDTGVTTATAATLAQAEASTPAQTHALLPKVHSVNVQHGRHGM